MFVAFYPQLQALNLMHLQTPQSAILSAIIFHAAIIVALIPACPRGCSTAPTGASALLVRNLPHLRSRWLIVPFIGIKLIDNGHHRRSLAGGHDMLKRSAPPSS